MIILNEQKIVTSLLILSLFDIEVNSILLNLMLNFITQLKRSLTTNAACVLSVHGCMWGCPSDTQEMQEMHKTAAMWWMIKEQSEHDET